MKRIQLNNNWYKLIQQSHRNAHVCFLQPIISTEKIFTNLELKKPGGQWSLQLGIFLVSLTVYVSNLRRSPMQYENISLKII